MLHLNQHLKVIQTDEIKGNIIYTANPLIYLSFPLHRQRPTICSVTVSSVPVDQCTFLYNSHLQISFTFIVSNCQPPGMAATFFCSRKFTQDYPFKAGLQQQKRSETQKDHTPCEQFEFSTLFLPFSQYSSMRI